MGQDSYWERRSREREAEWTQISQETIERELAEQYARSLQRIQNEINALYGRFSQDNAMSIAEAQKLITGPEFRAWRMDIADYVKQIEATGSKELLRELNVLAMRSRISRLDKLYGDTIKELLSMGIIVDDKMTEFLTRAYEDNYYHARYDLGIAGIGVPRNLVSKAEIAKVLANPWSGKNYSTRLWGNTEKLAKVIKREVTNGIHRGISNTKLAKHVQQAMDSGRKEAERLVRTEMNYVNNQANLDSIRDADMPYYQFIAVMDSRTSRVCKDHNNEVYKVADAIPGENLPPLHANCRSTIAATLTGYKPSNETEKNKLHISKDMSYEAYYDEYVTAKSSKGNYGALNDDNDPWQIRRDEHAVRYYETLRNSNQKYLAETISNNTGMRQRSVEKVLAHVLFNRYNLDKGYSRFEESYEMSQSFQRLIMAKGKHILPKDIVLLKHERLEYELMNRYGKVYEEAHALSNKKHNYEEL